MYSYGQQQQQPQQQQPQQQQHIPQQPHHVPTQIPAILPMPVIQQQQPIQPIQQQQPPVQNILSLLQSATPQQLQQIASILQQEQQKQQQQQQKQQQQVPAISLQEIHNIPSSSSSAVSIPTTTTTIQKPQVYPPTNVDLPLLQQQQPSSSQLYQPTLPIQQESIQNYHRPPSNNSNTTVTIRDIEGKIVLNLMRSFLHREVVTMLQLMGDQNLSQRLKRATVWHLIWCLPKQRQPNTILKILESNDIRDNPVLYLWLLQVLALHKKTLTLTNEDVQLASRILSSTKIPVFQKAISVICGIPGLSEYPTSMPFEVLDHIFSDNLFNEVREEVFAVRKRYSLPLEIDVNSSSSINNSNNNNNNNNNNNDGASSYTGIPAVSSFALSGVGHGAGGNVSPRSKRVELRTRMRQLLLQHPKGLATTTLPQLWLSTFGVHLGYKKFGYPKLQKLLEDEVGDFVTIVKETSRIVLYLTELLPDVEEGEVSEGENNNSNDNGEKKKRSEDVVVDAAAAVADSVVVGNDTAAEVKNNAVVGSSGNNEGNEGNNNTEMEEGELEDGEIIIETPAVPTQQDIESLRLAALAQWKKKKKEASAAEQQQQQQQQQQQPLLEQGLELTTEQQNAGKRKQPEVETTTGGDEFTRTRPRIAAKLTFLKQNLNESNERLRTLEQQKEALLEEERKLSQQADEKATLLLEKEIEFYTQQICNSKQ